MNDLTISMALMDFVPVIFFGVGSIFLLRIGYRYLNIGLYTAMAGGAILCFTGGFYKASSKLLEAAFNYEIAELGSIQFILMAPGFVLLFIAAIGLFKKQETKHFAVAAPAMAVWKIPFLAIMTLANMGFLIVMSVLAYKNKLYIPLLFYVLSIVTMVAMSYLATLPPTIAMQWIAQSVNSLVQFFAMAGHILLYRGFKNRPDW